MDNRDGKRPYTEAQATRWLAWLARGMQRHGQTVFHIEQLQPSWLPSEGQRHVYILTTRLFQGIVLGLVAGSALELTQTGDALPALLGGLLGGVGTGLIDALRLPGRGMWRWLRYVSPPWLVAFINIAVFCLIYTLSFGAPVQFYPDASYAMKYALLFGLQSGLLWGIRGARKTIDYDVQIAEALSWSWRGAVKGCVWGVSVGLGGILLLLLAEKVINGSWSLPGRMWPLFVGGGGVIGSVFGGVRRAPVEKTPVPIQGIKLAFRNMVVGGSISGLSAGPLVVLMVFLFSEWGGLNEFAFLSLLFGLAVGVVGALWYGGADLVQHYILRRLLARNGYLPQKLIPFLDYAAEELHFLQKVGGGYLFIHRYLLEHFAAMEGTPEPQAEVGEQQETVPS